MSKGIADNAITLSSEEDAGATVKPAKKSKVKQAKQAVLKAMTLNKGKFKYVPVDSSDDEACTVDAAPPTNNDVAMMLLTTNGPQSNDDYQGPRGSARPTPLSRLTSLKSLPFSHGCLMHTVSLYDFSQRVIR